MSNYGNLAIRKIYINGLPSTVMCAMMIQQVPDRDQFHCKTKSRIEFLKDKQCKQCGERRIKALLIQKTVQYHAIIVRNITRFMSMRNRGICTRGQGCIIMR